MVSESVFLVSRIQIETVKTHSFDLSSHSSLKKTSEIILKRFGKKKKKNIVFDLSK